MAVMATPRKRPSGTTPKESRKIYAIPCRHLVIVWGMYSCAFDPGDSKDHSMTSQPERENRRNEPSLHSRHRGWMEIVRTLENDETNPATTTDHGNFDETNPAAMPDPREFYETKPQLRRIGRLCRLNGIYGITRIARIAWLGESGRFSRWGKRFRKDSHARDLEDPGPPGFRMAESSVPSVVRSAFLAETRLFNNCHASVGTNGMSNIDGDAFLRRSR